MFVESGALSAHAASGRENQWRKYTMFNITHSLIVFSNLGRFMLFVEGTNVLGTITWSIRVKNPYIKKGILS